MVAIWERSLQSKAIFFFYTGTLVLFTIAMVVPRWATANFIMPNLSDSDSQTIYAHCYAGILKSCVELTVNATQGMVDVGEVCQTKPGEDWQIAVVTLMCSSSISCFVGLILVVINIIVPKLSDSLKMKLSIAAVCAVSSLLLNAALITVYINKKTAVDVSVIIEVDFTLDWVYYLAVGVSFLYSLLHIYLVVDICIAKRNTKLAALCFKYKDMSESAPLRQA